MWLVKCCTKLYNKKDKSNVQDEKKKVWKESKQNDLKYILVCCMKIWEVKCY